MQEEEQEDNAVDAPYPLEITPFHFVPFHSAPALPRASFMNTKIKYKKT